MVVGVIPDLGDLVIHGLRGVAVDDGEIFDFCPIIGNSLLFDRVDNLLTCFIDWKIAKGGRPIIRCSNCLRCHDRLGRVDRFHQMNSDLAWAFAILVVSVLPSLIDCDSSFFRCVGVGQIVAILACAISWYFFFCDGIAD